MASVPYYYLSPEEYLALERKAEFKSEYMDGVVYLMAGAGKRHNLIVANIIITLGGQLKGRPCRVYPSDLKVRVPNSKRFFYPDVSVVCGDDEFADDKQDVILNPTLIVEVSSETTAAFDRGKKFLSYQQIASLQEYLLVSQDEILVEGYARQGNDTWLYTKVTGLDGSLTVPSIECELALKDVYDKATWHQEAAQQMVSTSPQLWQANSTGISELYQNVRARTMQIVAPLEIEDYVIQTAEFMSPPRWHIGHTSWFFETLLQVHQPGYKIYSADYLFYFNSYYEGFGARIERPKRGTKSRPTVKKTVAYRNHVDEHMRLFLEALDGHSHRETVLRLVRLGLEHEMQHQELLVYDIKHLLCDQFDAPIQPAPKASVRVDGMAEIEGGLFGLGYDGQVQSPKSKVQSPSASNYDFAFDNEKPAHQVYLQDFALDRALVSNGDYLEFMRAGGYRDFRWWFSEGWEVVNREYWAAPLYWELHDDEWLIRDFSGLHPVAGKANEPVSHVSYFEASAFAKWAGKRLPTEAEWEKAACFAPGEEARRLFPWGDDPVDAVKGNLFENGLWSVAAIGAFPEGQNAFGCQQMIGDVWEWTTSDYVPYPGFKSEFDEYNDKWFVNQKVLRGGSFATPQLHIRSTYRNFFHAHERWMVSGFRCAQDL